jgi:hypothetical protein
MRTVAVLVYERPFEVAFGNSILLMHLRSDGADLLMLLSMGVFVQLKGVHAWSLQFSRDDVTQHPHPPSL